MREVRMRVRAEVLGLHCPGGISVILALVNPNNTPPPSLFEALLPHAASGKMVTCLSHARVGPLLAPLPRPPPCRRASSAPRP